MKLRFSKKISSMLFAVLIIASFCAGCGSANSEDAAAQNQDEEEVAEKIETEEDTTIEETSKAVTIEEIEEIEETEETEETEEMALLYVTINDTQLTAKLEDNTSVSALMEKLSEGDITIDMHDYSNFEKVGSLGFDLPRNDESITTKAGDIILYQGDQLVFYYDTNSWNFTKLGEFQDISEEELRQLFGDGNITATLSASE